MNFNFIGILFCIPIGIALSLVISDARRQQRKIKQRVDSYRQSLPAESGRCAEH
jgi:hypothetical protein